MDHNLIEREEELVLIQLLLQLIDKLGLMATVLCGGLLYNGRGRRVEAIGDFNHNQYRVDHINQLVMDSDRVYIEQLRVDRRCFKILCDMVENIGGLPATKWVSIEEKVVMFLSVLAQDKKNRVFNFDFKRSGHTVSIYFRVVLVAVLRLQRLLLVKSEPITETEIEPRGNIFQNCLGALDGTHVNVRVMKVDSGRYRNRKGVLSTNVLGVCDINMNIIFVLPGWEGSAADGRILKDAVTRANCLRDSVVMQPSVLAVADLVALPVSVVLNAVKTIKNEVAEQVDPRVISQASLLSKLPVDSSSIDIAIFVCRSSEFPAEPLFGEISRVLKPGGIVLLLQSSESATEETITTPLERKLLVAGFLDIQVVPVKSAAIGSLGIRAAKPSWKIGSSFALKKKPVKTLPKVQIDDDMDLIDEDSLLTEDDLKKPQLPPVGDCEVGATKKACKNCTCGRAEAEDKVEKLGLTMDQIDNPQSACGSCGLGDAFRCSTCPYKGLPLSNLARR